MGLETQTSKLREIRSVMLQLHKTLLDYEREVYERAHGRVDNSYEVLQLVMHDPWFHWLHSLSELVVKMDETLDAKEPSTESDINAVTQQARELVTPAENGTEFQRKYFDALQNSPDAVLAHAEAVKLLGGAKETRTENKRPES